MRKSSEPEVVNRSGASTVQPNCKPQKLALREQAKPGEISKRMRRLGNHGTAAPPFGPPSFKNPFQQTAQRAKVVGETTAETGSLLSASIESICAEGGSNNNNNNSNKKHNSALQIVDHEGTKPVSGDLSGFQYHILAVDDSHIDQMVIEKLLKVSAYKVTTVNSALRALEVLGLSDSPSSFFKKLDIDLIMTDYCMPEMSGYDLLKRVKMLLRAQAKTSAWKEIPVVVMSSENDSNRIKRCLVEGAEEFIIKPIQMADVKRLQGHIKPLSSTSSLETTKKNSSSSTCGKRKATNCVKLQEVLNP